MIFPFVNRSRQSDSHIFVVFYYFLFFLFYTTKRDKEKTNNRNEGDRQTRRRGLG